jgi:ADP-ribosylglycohydrolase
VLLAVNHSGDSDSTGAITGNLLGAIHDYDGIPAQWVHDLELNDVLKALCRDWNALFIFDPAPDLEQDESWLERYPGW